jgi:hypothetical protein
MYRNSKSKFLCSGCLKDVNPGDLYYRDTKTFYCIACREKQIKKPRSKTKGFFTGISLAPIGSKQWQAEFIKALKHKSCKITISDQVYKKSPNEIIADLFNVKLKKTIEDKQVNKAKLFLINLHDSNQL